MSGETKFFSFRPRAFMAVSGEDADTFLQGQFTNDLRREPGAAVYGLFLNQKGKVLADAYALRHRVNDWTLVSQGSPAQAIIDRLAGYVVADDVSITDETGATAGVALLGKGGAEMVAAWFGTAPSAGTFCRSGDLLVFRGRRTTDDNFEIVGPEAAWRAVIERLRAAGVREASLAEVESERIRARRPSVPQDLGEGDLPNEGAIQDAAISYTKGCYLGQEVMSRLKNLGQVRRRLFVVTGGGAAPPPHAPLFQQQRQVGEVRTAAPDQGRFVAMAMLSLVHLDEGVELTLGPASAASVTILDRV